MSESPYGWKGYNVKTNTPIRYENLSEDFGALHPKIEYYIRKRGDVLKHASNVKASMTEWDAHNNNSHIKAIAEKALFLCQEGMETKYPLEIADCWGFKRCPYNPREVICLSFLQHYVIVFPHKRVMRNVL